MGSEPLRPSAFTLNVRSGEDGRSTIAVAGALDLVTAEEFSAAVRLALARGGVLLDLGALEFMDSSGMRALNTALREASAQGRDLRVCDAMRPSVAEMLELTGMLGLLPMEGCP